MIPGDRFPYVRGMAERVAAGDHDGLPTLEFGLDRLLEGVGRLRSVRDRATGWPRP